MLAGADSGARGGRNDHLVERQELVCTVVPGRQAGGYRIGKRSHPRTPASSRGDAFGATAVASPSDASSESPEVSAATTIRPRARASITATGFASQSLMSAYDVAGFQEGAQRLSLRGVERGERHRVFDLQPGDLSTGAGAQDRHDRSRPGGRPVPVRGGPAWRRSGDRAPCTARVEPPNTPGASPRPRAPNRRSGGAQLRCG